MITIYYYRLNSDIADNISSQIQTRAILGAHNLFGVGNSLNEWFAAMNDGKLPTKYLASDTITGTVNKDTNSIVITAYDNNGYRWGCKKINLKKNTRYTFSCTSCDGIIELFGKNNADDRAVVISGLINGVTVDSGDYDWWYVGFYPTFGGGYFSITDLLVRLETDADLTYQPYAKPNTELTKDNIGLTENEFVNGAVNLFHVTATSQVKNGVTFTVNSDGSVTANGTATAHTIFSLGSRTFTAGKMYKLTGSPSDSSSNTYYQVYYNGTNFALDYGSGYTFIAQDNNVHGIDIVINQNQTVSNVVFKPMITVADMPNSDYDHYVPYAMTNKQLTENLSIKVVGGYTWNASINTTKSIYVKRYGNIVFVYGFFNATATLPIYADVLTGLPHCVVNSLSGDAKNNMSFVLQNDGTSAKIVNQNPTAVNTQYAFSFVYLTDTN